MIIFSKAGLSFSKILLLSIISVSLLGSCGDEDGQTGMEIIIDSPYFLKVTGGIVIDVNHGLDNQAKAGLSYDNVCEVLYGNCTDTPAGAVMLSSSFGPNSVNYLNFALTNLVLDPLTPLDEVDLESLVQSIPVNSSGSIDYTSGTKEDGIESGNIYIGNDNYLYSYTYSQPAFADFKITEVAIDTFAGEKVIGIEFNFECKLIDDITGEIKNISSGSRGYLPFKLTYVN